MEILDTGGLKMTNYQQLFSLWCNIGREPKIVIPQYERPSDPGPSFQGWPSKVNNYSFNEND